MKCINEGQAPCYNCRKSGRLTCVLTRPESRAKVPKRATTATSRDSQPTPVTQLRDSNIEMEQTGPFLGPNSPQLTVASSAALPLAQIEESVENVSILHHLSSIPNTTLVAVVNIFTKKFPEFSFIHLPSFVKQIQRGSHHDALMVAILALVGPLLLGSELEWGGKLLPSDIYAEHTWQILSESLYEKPKIQNAQALLILALYYWGARGFYKSWMYTGKYR